MKLQILKRAVSEYLYFFPYLKGTEGTKEKIPNMISTGQSRQDNMTNIFTLRATQVSQQDHRTFPCGVNCAVEI